MSVKKVSQGKAARESLLHGIDFIANAVKVTLGPGGRNAVIGRREFGLTPLVTLDGVTVANYVCPEDPSEQMGADLIREASSKTADAAGDGTTTSSVLAQAMIHAGIKAIDEGANPVALKRGMDAACAALVTQVRRQSQPATPEILKCVAKVSAHGDETIASITAGAMEKIGPYGIFTLEESASGETTYDVVSGLKLYGAGYLSQYFITNPQTMKCEFENCFVLLYEGKVTSGKALIPLVKQVIDSGKQLLIIAGDYEHDALQMLVTNRVKLSLPVCAVNINAFGQRRKDLLQDIAALTGGQAITEDRGVKLENIDLTMLGSARRIIVGENDTKIVEGSGSQEEVVNRVSEIQRKIETALGDEKKLLQQRLASLTGGIAVIKCGAVTITEMREKKDRIEDACYACKAAAEEGVVPGGGIALLRATFEVGLKLTGDEAKGAAIVLDSCSEPLLQIATNAGFKARDILERVFTHPQFRTHPIGFDAREGKVTHMLLAGIVDPTKVVVETIKNSTSIAAMILNTECVVAETPKEKADAQ